MGRNVTLRDIALLSGFSMNTVSKALNGKSGVGKEAAERIRQYAAQLREIFPSTDKVETEVTTHGVFYPSDQSSFPCGVGVAALKRSRRFGLLYMNRIHTKRDTMYREENIAYLVQGCIALTAALS